MKEIVIALTLSILIVALKERARVRAWMQRIRKPQPLHIKEFVNLLLQQPPEALIHDRLRTLNERLQISEAENVSLRQWRGKLLELLPPTPSSEGMAVVLSQELKELLERDPLLHAARFDPILSEIRASDREAVRARLGLKSDLGPGELKAIRDQFFRS